jgi:hypothetical protein
MTIHQCPKCELRFDYKTELDDHCRHDHPEFRHQYPATAPPPPAEPEPVAEPARPSPPPHIGLASFVGWLNPASRRERRTGRQAPPQ